MFVLDLQLFAHKKGVGSSKMVEIANLNAWVLKDMMAR